MKNALKISTYIFLIINLTLILFDYIQGACNVINKKHVTGFNISDFLINYQGGYVRRGLLGEILHCICISFNLDPRFLILPICCFSFLTISIIIIKKFRKENISLWILCAPFTYFGGEAIRKDFIIMLIGISILAILKKSLKKPSYSHLLFILIIFILNIHEASFFCFVSIVIFYILFATENKFSKLHKLVFTAACLLSFALISTYKGYDGIAETITQSWKFIYPTQYANCNHMFNSITALEWSLSYAINFHLECNLGIGEGHLLQSFIIRNATILIILFLMIQISFRNVKQAKRIKLNTFTNIAIFQLISLSPMFTILSCDFRRVCFYWTISTLISYAYLKDIGLSPAIGTQAKRITQPIAQALQQRKLYPLSVILLLCFSVPNVGNNWDEFISPLARIAYTTVEEVLR